MKKYIKLLRVKHYIKNFLIFLPLIFSANLTDKKLLSTTIIGFFSFCLLSSAIYIFNDIKDIADDKKHPTKRYRPLPSGEISIKTAYIILFICLASSFTLNFILADNSLSVWMSLILYATLNIAYSMGLKNIAIIDISILVSGYIIRVFYGSFITGIEVSSWLYLTIMSASFYLALGKRKNELSNISSDYRKVLAVYNKSFLEKNMYLCLGLTIVFYSLWSVYNTALDKINYTANIWTVPIVILIFLRYNLILEGDTDGDPVSVLFADKALLIMTAIYIILIFLIIYL